MQNNNDNASPNDFFSQLERSLGQIIAVQDDAHLDALADVLAAKRIFGHQKYRLDSIQHSQKNFESVNCINHAIEEQIDTINYLLFTTCQLCTINHIDVRKLQAMMAGLQAIQENQRCIDRILAHTRELCQGQLAYETQSLPRPRTNKPKGGRHNGKPRETHQKTKNHGTVGDNHD